MWGAVGVILGHWFLGLSECRLCGSVLMLAGQVPVCDCHPQPLSQWGSLGVNTSIVQQELLSSPQVPVQSKELH